MSVFRKLFPARQECRHVAQLAELKLLLLKVLKREDLLMALSEEVKAALAVVEGKIDAASATGSEAVADIQALHAKLDGLLDQGDVEGARAALASVSAKADALAEVMAGLKSVVDIPE